MEYLLGIDIGTSGTKTGLYSRNGEMVATSTADYPLYQPQNGWAEQRPEDWWEAVCKTIRNVIAAGKVATKDIKAIGLSGQMHGLVMLDGENRVIRPAILWCDSRTGAECEEITQRVGAKRLIEITANPALAGFTASKILWVRNNEPENYESCKHILLPKDYIRFKLTGEYATEVSDASGMQLLDVPARSWSREILELLDIDEELLGRVYESVEITGKVNAEASLATGINEGIPVVGGAGDNAAAAVGTGVVNDGMAFTTIGSSGVVYAHTSTPAIDPKGRVHTFCSAVPGEWHVMGVTQGAGLSLKWFKDNFCENYIKEAKDLDTDPYVLMSRDAEQVPIGADRLIYLPYLMGERTPHLDPNCRGVFFGLSAIHTRREMVRAIMEGVSYSLKDCYGILLEMGIKPRDMLACGGGGRSVLWRQMLSDLYECRVKTTISNEGPSLGAAILAGVGVGLYTSIKEACEVFIKIKDIQNPISENTEKYLEVYTIYKKVYEKLREQFVELKALKL